MTEPSPQGAADRGLPEGGLTDLERTLTGSAHMRMVSRNASPPRLISSITPDLSGGLSTPNQTDSRYTLRGANFFSGNGRAVFIGILVGSLGICVAGFLFSRHYDLGAELRAASRFLRVRTHTLSPPHDPSALPAPVTVQLNSDLVRVTAIALGHPRLAVINGEEVAEGDKVTIHTPTSSVAITLRVVKIGEGRIDLTDGTQMMTARLRVPDLAHPRNR